MLLLPDHFASYGCRSSQPYTAGYTNTASAALPVKAIPAIDETLQIPAATPTTAATLAADHARLTVSDLLMRWWWFSWRPRSRSAERTGIAAANATTLAREKAVFGALAQVGLDHADADAHERRVAHGGQ